jgi:hypothetical protein
MDDSAALQAQIDDTIGVMRENINKVSQRGERLDSLQDKTDNLVVSAQGFRRGANRVRRQMNPWTRAYDAFTQKAAQLSIESQKTIRDMSTYVYKTGTVLFSGSNDDDGLDEFEGKPIKTAEEPFGKFGEGDEEISNGNIVKDLLAAWTTLPLIDDITADDQIQNESIEPAAI